ncbi:peroxisomal membrane protein PEX13-like isoform X2 [Ostrea edulis]|uniref:peroxisomal membrane protein PEX13-like isoform X2 n=1 Tax=Ostrea edulis TaxID=37623 RepID=UPI0024AFD33E|nr:peroxisomal membrane protein PEX13-like isoform X2 [Ostrea edulis]
MAAPPKPWENAGINYQNSGSLPVNSMSGFPGNAGSLPPCCAPSASGGNAPPPVPSRPVQNSMGSRFSSPYGGYSSLSPYSSYGMSGSGYGGYSPYSGYGSMGYGYGGMGGYNRMGYGDDYGQNNIARLAEESSRPAFQSIESIVNAFTSVSMMLDSTFQAMYNSFRAVVGVADNFTRLKSQIGQVLSAFAVFRFLKYLYRKLLVLLRLRPQGYAEEAWVKASDVFGQLPDDGGAPKKSTWPIMLFFGVIMGGPWLIWKMISSLSGPSVVAWASGEDDHFVARAEHDFNGSGEEELSFKSGQLIKVAPKEIQPRMRGWLLASVDGKKVGIIPANYVKVLGKKRGAKTQTQSVPGGVSGPTTVPPLTTGNSASAPDLLSETKSCCKKSCGQSSNEQLKTVASAPGMENGNSIGMEDNSSFANLEGAFLSDSSLQNRGNSEPENMNAEDILNATDDKVMN